MGPYELRVSVPNFGEYVRSGIQLEVGQTARIDVQLQVAKEKETVNVDARAPLVDSGSNVIGNVVTGRELVELPLNGRNFTQLGLLQPGVAPMTAGLAEAGGSLRAGQAYAVNGQRPESNNYLLDGVTNVNRVDGGYALKTPVDAIQEFRILTETAPAEYGGTSGATTTVVTRSGSNQLHGTVYEFLRNDALDARNFFASSVEPLKQNQFGVTLGGPLRRNKDFFFGYYEGFRNRQGITQSATVPSDAERDRRLLGIARSADRPARPADQLPQRPAVSEQPDSRHRCMNRDRAQPGAVLSARQCRAESLRDHADDAEPHGPGRRRASTMCSTSAISFSCTMRARPARM